MAIKVVKTSIFMMEGQRKNSLYFVRCVIKFIQNPQASIQLFAITKNSADLQYTILRVWIGSKKVYQD